MSEPFHAVEFMRRRREEIDREDAGLTWEEKRLKTREALRGDPLWERVREGVLSAGTATCPPANSEPAGTGR